MWTDYKPTKKERYLIEGAFRYIEDCHSPSGEIARLARDEKRGYGNRNIAIPMIAAKALCVKWFLQGVNNPDIMLRDYYHMRPAAVWVIGKGADRATGAPAINKPALENAVAAHEAAFKRMMDKSTAALEAALKAARKPAAETIAGAL